MQTKVEPVPVEGPTEAVQCVVRNDFGQQVRFLCGHADQAHAIKRALDEGAMTFYYDGKVSE